MNDDIQLNIAGRITKAFARSKLTLLILLMGFLAGTAAFLVTPREENPQIVVPAANIIVQKPGASPKEIEQLILKPLEAILQGMEGIDHTYGMARESMGVVSVQFEVGEDKEDSLVKLYDRIMSHLDQMPPGTEQPLVHPVDVDDVPIITISLSSASLDDRELRKVASTLMEYLRQVDGASNPFILGGRKRQINVELDLARMRRYNVTLNDIEGVLKATNVDMPTGTFVNHGKVETVQAGGKLQTSIDVANVVVGLYNHRPVYLKNIATITDGPGEIKTVHRIGFGPAYEDERPEDLEIPAVTLALAKRKGTNAVTVAKNILKQLETVRDQVIPEGVMVNVTRDDGKKADQAVNLLMEHLGIAVGSIIILLIVFLGPRAAGIVTLTIPLILLITLLIGMMAGQTINRITLFALILSLGLLVDDSIVVIENVFRHYSRKGIDRFKGVVAAVNEIGKPTNLATFTVILAFLPMFWVTGMMGPYMAPIPFFVPVAMITSLAVAYTVAPWAAYRWCKLRGADEHEHGGGILERGYHVIMKKLVASKPLRILFYLFLLALLGLALAMPSMGLVTFKMLPKNNTNTFNITIDARDGTALENTDRIARMVGDIVRANPEVASYETSVGEPGVIDFNGLLRGSGLKRGPQVAEVRVHLRDKHHRDISSIDIALQMRPALAELAQKTGATIKLVEDPPGPPVRATVLAEVYGPDMDKAREIALQLKQHVFMTTDDVVDIDTSVEEPTSEYKIKVNREKAALLGILPSQVAQTLRTFLAGYDIGTVHMDEEKEPVPIEFRVPVSDRRGPADLSAVFFTNRQGKQIPLSEIANIEKVPAPFSILHKDQRPVVFVEGEMAKTSQVYAVLRMWKYLKNNPLPNGIKLKQYFMADPDITGYSVRWDGEMRLTLDVFRDLGAAFGVAIVLIYLVLVGYYQSFIIPIIVMGAIPLTIIGIFGGHAFLNQPFTATSMIGMIALAGIVVRNSLLLIDFILEYRKSGHSVAEAVLQAGATRLRPIMLTALAIILGTFIMIFDPVFGGLAISLVFGTLVSTILTLFVIPLVYYGRYSRLEKKRQA
ncbi:MAG: AcrB/AcrD/AcrF family protein [Gammaproteobacteria bacterium]|nr:MAG: AcrB/AcrD/AcrF family protein [Gammaproteobacteria bacterium]